MKKKKKKRCLEKTLINGMTLMAAVLSCHAKQQRSPQQQRVNTREVLIIVPIGSLSA
jgi:hypothetical protein